MGGLTAIYDVLSRQVERKQSGSLLKQFLADLADLVWFLIFKTQTRTVNNRKIYHLKCCKRTHRTEVERIYVNSPYTKHNFQLLRQLLTKNFNLAIVS